MGADNQQVTSEELAWLAGIWEGEGWFSLLVNTNRKNSAGEVMPNGVQINLGVSNTDALLIRKIETILNNLKIIGRTINRGHSKMGKQDRFEIVICRNQYVNILCRALTPYMAGQKRKIAELVLDFTTRRLKFIEHGKRVKLSKEEWEIAKQVRILNAKSSGRNLNDYTTKTLQEG